MVTMYPQLRRPRGKHARLKLTFLTKSWSRSATIFPSEALKSSSWNGPHGAFLHSSVTVLTSLRLENALLVTLRHPPRIPHVTRSPLSLLTKGVAILIWNPSEKNLTPYPPLGLQRHTARGIPFPPPSISPISLPWNLGASRGAEMSTVNFPTKRLAIPFRSTTPPIPKLQGIAPFRVSLLGPIKNPLLTLLLTKTVSPIRTHPTKPLRLPLKRVTLQPLSQLLTIAPDYGWLAPAARVRADAMNFVMESPTPAPPLLYLVMSSLTPVILTAAKPPTLNVQWLRGRDERHTFISLPLPRSPLSTLLLLITVGTLGCLGPTLLELLKREMVSLRPLPSQSLLHSKRELRKELLPS